MSFLLYKDMCTFAVPFSNHKSTLMILITSDEQLRRFIPNVFSTVKGEMSLFEKLTSFLELAEQWAIETFVPMAIVEEEQKLPVSIILDELRQVVVTEAFRNAVPSLDLVLTPNGFGIVNNQNVAPASKERVERLLSSLELNRDLAIHGLLSWLQKSETWLGTEQCAFFGGTMFPNLHICPNVGYREHRWEKYQELRPILQNIELHIATQFIGEEQMTAFRKAAMQPSYTLPPVVQSVISSLKAVEVQMLKAHLSPSSPPCPPTNLVQIVDVIRNHPEEFPEWHNSAISDIFSPPLFNNCKNDTGYWF